MGVFPAASGNFLPETWRNLMSSPVSVPSRITLDTQTARLSHPTLVLCRIRPSLTSTQMILLLI